MPTLRRALAAGLLFWCATQSAACDQKAAPRAVEPARGLPPLDPSAPAVPAGPMARAEHAPVGAHGGDPHGMAGPQGGDTHAASPHGAGAPSGMEAMAPGEIAFDKKTVIAGVLKLDAKLKDKVKTGDVIYLVVRGPAEGGAPQGPVLAVKRLEAGEFPMAFQLDSRNAMVVGTVLKAPVVLNVRVDKDGDAITKNPGDVTGSLTVKSLPAEKIALALDTVL